MIKRQKIDAVTMKITKLLFELFKRKELFNPKIINILYKKKQSGSIINKVVL